MEGLIFEKKELTMTFTEAIELKDQDYMPGTPMLLVKTLLTLIMNFTTPQHILSITQS